MDRHRQRISLHELTALRVDVNGERVQSSLARSRKQAFSAKLDARGNPVTARPFVKKSRKHRLDSDDEHLELELSDANEGRLQKRQKREKYLAELLPFLHPDHQTHAVEKSDKELPSSDLLKVIHHFASCYYDERGILTASARAARTERRSKTKSKAGIIGKDTGNSLERNQSLGRESTNKGAGTPENRIRDMHRAFDGSTLLLIGMILQSHIEARINRTPPLPSAWEDQIIEDMMRIEKRSRMGRERSRPMRGMKAEDGVEPEPMVGSNESGKDSDPDSEERGEEEGEDAGRTGVDTDDQSG